MSPLRKKSGYLKEYIMFAEKTDSESSCLLFEKEKRLSEKNENSCRFVCVYSSLPIFINYFRSFVGRARWSAQDDGLAIAGQEQNDKKGSLKLLRTSLRKTGENERKQQKTYKYNSKNFVSVDFPCVL